MQKQTEAGTKRKDRPNSHKQKRARDNHAVVEYGKTKYVKVIQIKGSTGLEDRSARVYRKDARHLGLVVRLELDIVNEEGIDILIEE